MAKLTTSDLTSLTSNEASAVSTINSNFADVEAALEKTLSRDGTTPNQMEADLDMNGNSVINVGTIDATEILLNGSPIGSSGPGGEHTHTAADISDFQEAVEDAIGAAIVAGSNVTVSYDDSSGETTISSTGGGSSSHSILNSIGATVGSAANVTTQATLSSYTLPAGTLATNGSVLRIKAAGRVANSARTRAAQLHFGGVNMGSFSTSGANAYTWEVVADIIRQGSSTQIGTSHLYLGTNNSTALALNQYYNVDTTEDLTADIVIKVTSTVSSGAQANDVTLNYFTIEKLEV